VCCGGTKKKKGDSKVKEETAECEGWWGGSFISGETEGAYKYDIRKLNNPKGGGLSWIGFKPKKKRGTNWA